MVLQRDDARKILQLSLVYFARNFVRCRGFGADKGEWPASAFGYMGEIAAVCVDDPMQVFAAFFGEWKAALFLVRIGQERT